jgi:hypothetical protein
MPHELLHRPDIHSGAEQMRGNTAFLQPPSVEWRSFCPPLTTKRVALVYRETLN